MVEKKEEKEYAKKTHGDAFHKLSSCEDISEAIQNRSETLLQM